MYSNQESSLHCRRRCHRSGPLFDDNLSPNWESLPASFRQTRGTSFLKFKFRFKIDCTPVFSAQSCELASIRQSK